MHQCFVEGGVEFTFDHGAAFFQIGDGGEHRLLVIRIVDSRHERLERGEAHVDRREQGLLLGRERNGDFGDGGRFVVAVVLGHAGRRGASGEKQESAADAAPRQGSGP